jgi:hypothetical protein
MLLSVIESETAPVRRLRAFERLEDELLRSPENHVEWSVDSDIARTLVLFGYGYPSSLVQKKAADISKLLASSYAYYMRCVRCWIARSSFISRFQLQSPHNAYSPWGCLTYTKLPSKILGILLNTYLIF